MKALKLLGEVTKATKGPKLVAPDPIVAGLRNS